MILTSLEVGAWPKLRPVMVGMLARLGMKALCLVLDN
jgi:hypothetical protein